MVKPLVVRIVVVVLAAVLVALGMFTLFASW